MTGNLYTAIVLLLYVYFYHNLLTVKFTTELRYVHA